MAVADEEGLSNSAQIRKAPHNKKDEDVLFKKSIGESKLQEKKTFQKELSRFLKGENKRENADKLYNIAPCQGPTPTTNIIKETSNAWEGQRRLSVALMLVLLKCDKIKSGQWLMKENLCYEVCFHNSGRDKKDAFSAFKTDFTQNCSCA